MSGYSVSVEAGSVSEMAVYCFFINSHRAVDPYSASCELDLIRTTLTRGKDAAKSCWISSFNVKTLSPSENL